MQAWQLDSPAPWVDAAPNLLLVRVYQSHSPAPVIPDDWPIGIDLPIGLDQTEDLPIGIKLPIGSRPKTRGLADRDQQTTITRSGYKDQPTPGRLGTESETMKWRWYRDTEANSKGASELGRLKRKRRKRIRRRRLNLTLTYHLLVHSFTHTSLHL